MRITIERTNLLKALATMKTVVERRCTVPILGNVKIEANYSGEVLLTGTDMDMVVVETVPATVAGEGAVTVGLYALYDLVKTLPGTIELATVQGRDEIVVAAGQSRSTLPTLPVGDFPVMAQRDMPHNFGIRAGELRSLLDRATFAISTEETRYYLNGIFLHADDASGTLRAVATDGHRLARIDAPLPDGAAGMLGVIVPRKAVAVLGKMLAGLAPGEVIDVSAGAAGSQIVINAGGAMLRARLIDGPFPDYQRVIPSAPSHKLVVPARAFCRAVSQVATVATDRSRPVKLMISRDRIMFSVISPDAGRSMEEIDAEFSGEGLKMGFNAGYLLDVVGQIDGADAELLIEDNSAPVIVRDPKDASALYVQMPMRV